MTEHAAQAQPSFVLPMATAVERYRLMQVEAILNTEYEVTQNLAPIEHCLRHSKDADVTADLLNLPAPIRALAVERLQAALQGGRIEEIYGLRGGVLCVLLPATSPALDRAFTAVAQEIDGAPSRHAFSELANELFSGLTPGQVWAGTGKLEMQLADLILPQLWEQTRELSFPTPGAANGEWLSRLRLWSYNPAPVSNWRGRVVDLIQLERNQNLRKRLTFAEELGLQVDFQLSE
jgi:hypothetical protein